jgi:hypothetical protein
MPDYIAVLRQEVDKARTVMERLNAIEEATPLLRRVARGRYLHLAEELERLTDYYHLHAVD